MISDGVLHDVGAALSSAAGGSVAISSAMAVTEGWSARFGAYPWIARCAVEGPPGWGVTSVIVKTRRPDGHWRAGDTTGRERAALTFLQEVGSDAGPRILAHDDALGFVVLEDLGSGSALEDLLVDDDPEAATAGFVALAEAVGRMHAWTRGRQDAFYAHLRGPGINPQRDRVSLNCRLRRGSARLLDFEGAKFQHALLDAAHLRLPFYGGPCWSRIPAEVGEVAETAYRKAFAKTCPSVLDEQTYAAGMAAATAAWAVTRLVRLPKPRSTDEP